MSEKDQIKPYHAPTVGSGQEAADAVADVLKHAAERDLASKKKVVPKGQPKWALPLGLNLALLAVYFWVAEPQWVQMSPIQPPPAAEQVASLRTAMYFSGIARIETFLVNNGRLPTSLEEAGSGSLVGMVDYVVHGALTYTLISSIGDQVIAYDSATQTPADFTGAITLPG
jgi:hypothetical protein